MMNTMFGGSAARSAAGTAGAAMTTARAATEVPMAFMERFSVGMARRGPAVGLG